MKNLSLNDETQAAILPHLQETEHMLARVASKVSGKDRGAEVIAMPDLGFANNVRRMMGGFYTGAVYHWETDVPFVPVDATLNSCGVSMFRLRNEISTQTEFEQRVERARSRTREPGFFYKWNFASGNHFITYGVVEGAVDIADGPYLMMHSSASEFKNQHNGLYPVEGNSFYDQIETLADPHTHRTIRYIQGRTAGWIIDTVQNLEQLNADRHEYFAGEIAGGHGEKYIERPLSNEQHYGMPTKQSIAIGCQWNRKQVQILLTAPDKPIYLIEPEKGYRNDVNIDDNPLVLFPHGLGKQATQVPTLSYESDALCINGKNYGANDTLDGDRSFSLRNFDKSEASDGKVPDLITAILKACPGKILGTFKQVFSYHSKSQQRTS